MKRGDQPAFPDTMRAAEESIINQTPYQLPTGLTIREHFAAMAMQGFCALGVPPKDYEVVMVKESLKIADELLKQLES